MNFLCLDCCEGFRSFGNVLFFKSQVFLDSRAQVFELSEETQNFLCLDCCEGFRSFGNVLFFKSQVFLDSRAQVFELSEETQGVTIGVHGTHVR